MESIPPVTNSEPEFSADHNTGDFEMDNEKPEETPAVSQSQVVVDQEQYRKLQQEFDALQSKFDKKKIIYNKINKGLKVISSYLNKKKKLEAERKRNGKPMSKGNKERGHRKHHHSKSPVPVAKHTILQSTDYNDYNFSEADYENTTNNDTTPKQALLNKISPKQIARNSDSATYAQMKLKSSTEDHGESNGMKVKFDTPSLQKVHTKDSKKHLRTPSNNLIINGNEPENALFAHINDSFDHSNDALDFLDHEDLTNLKELEELNRLLNGDYASDDHMSHCREAIANSAKGRYCESCGENVDSDESDSSDEDLSTSSDSEDLSSGEISVSGMSGWSGLSNIKNEDYDFENSDGQEHSVHGDEGAVFVKNRKSIQFDTQGEVNNQLKIHQHKIKRKNRQKLFRRKSSDIEDYSMSDSSLPISRITTQNTTNSQTISVNEMDADKEESEDADNNFVQSSERRNSSVHTKQKGKHMSHKSKSRQYDAIKELHRKAIRMYKKKLLKKKERLLKKSNPEEIPQLEPLKPIESVLEMDRVAEEKENVVSSISMKKFSNPNAAAIESKDFPAATSHSKPIFSPTSLRMPQVSFAAANGHPFSGVPQQGNVVTTQLNNGGLITPFKEGQPFFAVPSVNGNNNNAVLPTLNPSSNSGFYQMNTPVMSLFMQGSAQNPPTNNPIIDSPNINFSLTDTNALVASTKPLTAASPKYSNLRSPNFTGSNYFKYDPKKQSIISPNYTFNPISPMPSSTNFSSNLSSVFPFGKVSTAPSGKSKSMTNVIHQLASVCIQPDNTRKSQTPVDLGSETGDSFSHSNTASPQVKIRKPYTKLKKVILPPEFESRDVITEKDLFELYGLKLSEKIKSTIDIWLQYHEVTEKDYSFERLDLEFGKKWKIKCEPKFIKKYNRRYLLIKSVKMALERDQLDDPYVYLNKLDRILFEERKPISHFYKKTNLPSWLLDDMKRDVI